MIKRLQLALAVLAGGLPKVIFDYKAASGIYVAANGRYDSDGSKAVPFVILETAKALGAEITLFEEIAEKKESIADSISETHDRVQNVTARAEARIKSLEAEKAAVLTEAESIRKNAEGWIKALELDANSITAVAEFFTVKK